MFPQLHFTDGVPARPGCSPCLSPVWRRWPLRADHSSSKLLFACRHLKSITLTNPLSLELRYPWLHAGNWCILPKYSKIWGVTGYVRVDLVTVGGRSYLNVAGDYLSCRTPIDAQWLTCTWKRTCSFLNSCSQSHRMSGQLLCEWKRKTREG